jgi:hypothetical protein
MEVLIVFESMYGNTRAIAEAVAEGIGAGLTSVQSVHEAGVPPADLELLVVGGPTHMHGLSSSFSRRMAAEAVKDEGHTALDPGATEGPGLRRWLRDLPRRSGTAAAAFDTRGDRSAHVTGSAARGIARRLSRHGYEVERTESFFVDDSEGPLAEGELERARAWGAVLRELLPAHAELHV